MSLFILRLWKDAIFISNTFRSTALSIPFNNYDAIINLTVKYQILFFVNCAWGPFVRGESIKNYPPLGCWWLCKAWHFLDTQRWMLVSNLSTSTCYLQHRAALSTDYVFEYTHLYFIHLELFSGARFLIWAHFPVCASHVTPASPGPSVMVKAWRKQWWLAPGIGAQPTPTCLEWFGKCFYLMLSERN